MLGSSHNTHTHTRTLHTHTAKDCATHPHADTHSLLLSMSHRRHASVRDVVLSPAVPTLAAVPSSCVPQKHCRVSRMNTHTHTHSQCSLSPSAGLSDDVAPPSAIISDHWSFFVQLSWLNLTSGSFGPVLGWFDFGFMVCGLH